MADPAQPSPGPLHDLDEWELAHLEPPATDDSKTFRDYGSARERVREFYRLNHTHQTVDFVREKHERYVAGRTRRMKVWEAMEFLDTLVDESDPDTELSQIQHLMQTAEAIRAQGLPRWFIATGLVHDLGKVLCLFGEPQWAVVGDTFPVGCAFSDRIVFPEFFSFNPDSKNPAYGTECGIYEPGCGLDNVLLSWGHDEYLYHVMKDHLPPEGLAMIRYHSFYPWHTGGAYSALTNERDRELLPWVRAFNPFDLYSKGHEPPDVEKLAPFYRELVDEFFPDPLLW
ncbi:MAG: inositol oxygenase family protein [Isosphaeraceae bacterium]|nr:inositol oxygenase family protein [Isosphaeraceae bacterium]